MELRKSLAVLLLLLGPAALVGQQQDGEETTPPFAEALKQGRVSLAFRYRFEHVDEDRFDDSAGASTLRIGLRYESQPWHGFSFVVEAEDVHDIATDKEYNDTRNGRTSLPVVADPEGTELNQAYLSFDFGTTLLNVGRQELNLGDQRFVGNVGWRQNHQSFDALRWEGESSGPVSWTYLYLDNVHRIFGDNRQMASHVVNLGFDVPGGDFNLYGLRLDFDHPRHRGQSTDTVGGEYVGSHSRDAWSFLWEAEYAHQRDAADNPNSVSVGYLHAMAGGKWGGHTVKLGYEVLGGSAEDGQFQTPLATLHKFNGWADKFLATPKDGLEDFYLAVLGSHGDFAWKAFYHDFSSGTGGFDFGRELDLEITYQTPWKQVFGLKAAFFDGRDFATDTDKVWFYTTYQF